MRKIHAAAWLAASVVIAGPAIAQTSPAPANSPSAAIPAKNMTAADFVNQAANSNMFEIQSSQLALSKSQENRIRDFAQRMIQDHTQAGDKLKHAAQGQTVPTSLDQEHARMLQQLQQASGNGFERSYVQMQFDGHQKAVSLFENYAQNGDNAQLKQFAQQTVPTLREHLQMITQIRNTMTAPAVAQNQTSGSMNTGHWMTQEQPGQWRTSKLIGLGVYNQNNERIGDINELLVDNSGNVQAAVIGVGGFLGLGEHDVAVPFDQLRFVNQPRTAAATAPGNRTVAGASPNAPATPVSPGNPNMATNNASNSNGINTTGAVTTGNSGNANRSTPDHAVLTVNMTKDQLKSAPEFKYNR